MTDASPPPLPDDDQPAEPRYEVAVPFTLCASNGGPHDDAAFSAGFEIGHADASMRDVAAAGGTVIILTVRTNHIPQLELHAMNRGFPNMDRRDHDGEHAGWSTVSFMADPDDML